MRWQSSGTSVTWRNDFTTGGPMVMLGTKWPSITSTCSSVPPPCSAACASSARRAKSADKIEGASSITGSSKKTKGLEKIVTESGDGHGSFRLHFRGVYNACVALVEARNLVK